MHSVHLIASVTEGFASVSMSVQLTKSVQTQSLVLTLKMAAKNAEMRVLLGTFVAKMHFADQDPIRQNVLVQKDFMGIPMTKELDVKRNFVKITVAVQETEFARTTFVWLLKNSLVWLTKTANPTKSASVVSAKIPVPVATLAVSTPNVTLLTIRRSVHVPHSLPEMPKLNVFESQQRV